MNPVTTQKLSVRRKSVAFSPGDEYKYGSFPAKIKCQFCEKDVKTYQKPVAGMITWFSCGLTALLGCFCGCCLIPKMFLVGKIFKLYNFILDNFKHFFSFQTTTNSRLRALLSSLRKISWCLQTGLTLFQNVILNC